jgi:nucleoside-diphosphate-sugar epimerase
MNKMKTERKILVTGANGQIGRVLTEELRKKFGTNAVLAQTLRSYQ